MRNIKISSYNLPDKTSNRIKEKLYSVYLGNDVREYFSNYKEVKKFLNEANTFLNLKLYEFNLLYSQIFAEYRKMWFYFYSEGSSLNAKFANYERSIIAAFDAIDKDLNWLVSRHGSPNYNVLTFRKLNNCFNRLLTVVDFLNEVNKIKNFYNDFNRLQVFDNQIKDLKKVISEFGKD